MKLMDLVMNNPSTFVGMYTNIDKRSINPDIYRRMENALENNRAFFLIIGKYKQQITQTMDVENVENLQRSIRMSINLDEKVYFFTGKSRDDFQQVTRKNWSSFERIIRGKSYVRPSEIDENQPEKIRVRRRRMSLHEEMSQDVIRRHKVRKGGDFSYEERMNMVLCKF